MKRFQWKWIFTGTKTCCTIWRPFWFAMVAILNPKWPPKYKNPPIWAKFGFQVDLALANCHHLVSVVCKLFTFQASSPKPLGQLEPNFAGMFLGWSSTKLLFFVPVGYSTWLPGPIICSDWLKFQRSSSLKLMN